MLAFAFLLMPFAYFYFEEEEDAVPSSCTASSCSFDPLLLCSSLLSFLLCSLAKA
jgi:hypothetical protein